MGCGGSKLKEAPTTTAAAHTNARTKPGEAQTPDFGVGEFYKPVKHLGRGGTGDTWLFKDIKTGKDVAIKFIKRPLPKVLHQNILREFTVSCFNQGISQKVA